jgi:membrane peptidoglycan carboxypeptidase
VNAQTRSSSAGRRHAPPARGWRRFFTWKKILLAVAAFVVLGVAGFAVAYATTPIPNPNQLAESQASIIYYADGKTEMARISQVNRESVPLSKVPVNVQRALLAAEDRTFYSNSGVSPTGIGRAVLVALKGGPTQGGSTITQQYVKNYFLSQDQTLSRKYKELLISLKIDQTQSKSKILENYLNTIYFGRGAYGIQTAAKAYFGKDVSQLSLSQGALLASVIRGPSLYDPANGPDALKNAKARVAYVLNGMRAEGWITDQQRAAATFPTTVPPASRKSAGSGPLGYITNEVKKEMRSKLNLTDADIDRGGYRIVTTIDKRAQNAAVNAVQQQMPTSAGAKSLHAGLAAIRPGDGAIVAMYGGNDYNKTQFNNATDAQMQAGSTFKAFGLLAALQKGISTKTRYDGHSPQFFPEFRDQSNIDSHGGQVVNFANEQFGRIDLRTAAAHSVNTVFAKLNIDVTPRATMDAAVAAGLPRPCDASTRSGCTPGLNANYSNIFGTASPHVLDMANAYATIAAQGVRATPYLIKSVTTSTGSIDYKADKSLHPVFDKAVTADATEALTHVVTEGTGQGALALGRPVAGKTGTTTKNRAVWFDGFTPQLAAAVGIYQGDGTQTISVPNFGEVTGGTFPVKIWTAFMQGALNGTPVVDFPSRAGIGDDTVPTPSVTTSTTTAPPTTTTAPPTTSTAPIPSTTQSPPPSRSVTLPFPGGPPSSSATSGPSNTAGGGPGTGRRH